MRRVWESQKKPEYHGRVTGKATQRPERRESLIPFPSLLVSLFSPLLKNLKEPDNKRELFTESQALASQERVLKDGLEMRVKSLITSRVCF